MASSYERRINPEGFAVSREVNESPQREQQRTEVNQLIRPDQASAPAATGRMNTTPGPRGD
ncbi:MAG: hypothetical protein KGR26_14335 [Cyanobacteria bacterium REEB65]|nr:hypothetical protein [Cyanobacteria bacterium REEB65]